MTSAGLLFTAAADRSPFPRRTFCGKQMSLFQKLKLPRAFLIDKDCPDDYNSNVHAAVAESAYAHV